MKGREEEEGLGAGARRAARGCCPRHPGRCWRRGCATESAARAAAAGASGCAGSAWEGGLRPSALA